MALALNVSDNPYTESEFLKICEDYRVPNDPMKYRDEKFYWTYQRSPLKNFIEKFYWTYQRGSLADDYIGPDSMTQ